MRYKTSILVIILLVSLNGHSQNEVSKSNLRKDRPNYIGITVGLGSGNFRDFATSPLIYNGYPSYVSVSILRYDVKRESESALDFTFGNYSSNFNNHIATSTVFTASLSHSELFQLNNFSSDKWNVKIGGLLNATANLRLNPSFMNNSFGYEIIPTIFGTVKVTKDISRIETKHKKFLFIKYQLKPKTRNLALKLNVGLINSEYRNGFIYANQSAILNEPKAFEGYKFKMLSGFRMGTVFDYTKSLKNKNKIRFSYLWDAYKTSNNISKFEMAQHIFKITLLFNTNNK